MVDQKSDIKEQIEYYAQQIADGNMDMSQMRKTLKDQGQSEDDIQHIVRRVDKRTVRITELKGLKSRGRGLFIGGILVIIFTLVVLTVSFFKSEGRIYLWTFAPLLIGLGLMMYGRNDMNRY
ncbi:hypothetical protein [Nonlabens xiamenensis]|uniref:hypothetical protein n=1 Tax=Nonlabens xiamenensis TaxID=2341043 RepID=UPI000F615C32|nr:hypothetical protein [Nonlabens xiamenensis]